MSQEASEDVLYSVTGLARDLGVSARTIRFYEDRGLITPGRAGATRVYTHRDRARMQLILRGKRLGFSLNDIREFLALYVPGGTQAEQLRKLLKAVQARVETLDQQQAAIAETLSELREIDATARASLKDAAEPHHPAPRAHQAVK
jgi:DNA-binding transcriptional MerR regulator